MSRWLSPFPPPLPPPLSLLPWASMSAYILHTAFLVPAPDYAYLNRQALRPCCWGWLHFATDTAHFESISFSSSACVYVCSVLSLEFVLVLYVRPSFRRIGKDFGWDVIQWLENVVFNHYFGSWTLLGAQMLCHYLVGWVFLCVFFVVVVVVACLELRYYVVII